MRVLKKFAVSFLYPGVSAKQNKKKKNKEKKGKVVRRKHESPVELFIYVWPKGGGGGGSVDCSFQVTWFRMSSEARYDSPS